MTLPQRLHNYRERTRVAYKTMAGVTMPSFMCRKCRTNKPTKGRRMIVPGYSKAGYACAECQTAT